MTPERPSLETLVAGLAEAAVEVAHGHGPLRLCARYSLPLDAQVLAARWQAEGLAARVIDSDDAGEFAIFESFDPNP